MISLYRDPDGEHMFSKEGNTLSTNEQNLNSISEEVTTHMRERIVELETLQKHCHCQVHVMVTMLMFKEHNIYYVYNAEGT